MDRRLGGMPLDVLPCLGFRTAVLDRIRYLRRQGVSVQVTFDLLLEYCALAPK